MRTKATVFVALFLGLAMLCIVTSDSSAQPKPKFRSDTGIIGPSGPDESIRITVVNRAEESLSFNFGKIEYASGPCDAGVCRQMLTSQTLSGPIRLDSNEGASLLINSYNSVRVIVTSSNVNTLVNVEIFNSNTGETKAFLIRQNDPSL